MINTYHTIIEEYYLDDYYDTFKENFNEYKTIIARKAHIAHMSRIYESSNYENYEVQLPKILTSTNIIKFEVKYNFVNSHNKKSLFESLYYIPSDFYRTKICSQILRIKFLKETTAANKIKSWYLKRFWSPDHWLGKKRLERSFENENYSVW